MLISYSNYISEVCITLLLVLKMGPISLISSMTSFHKQV